MTNPKTTLAIDVGNTNISFAVFIENELQHHWRMATDKRRTADDYCVWLTTLWQRAGLSDNRINHIIIASVVPEINYPLQQCLKAMFGTQPKLLTTADIDLPIILERPSEAGMDRLVNAVAAIKDYGSPAIIIDFGTATTFDVVDEKGEYIGGAIAPGGKLSLSALHTVSARLPHVDISKPSKAIGKTTSQAMQTGLYWGYVGLIKEILNQTIAELPQPPHIIATGGLASLYAPDLQLPTAPSAPQINIVLDDALTLRGILYLNR